MKYLTAPLSLAAAISLNVGLAVAAELSTLAGPAVVTSSPVLSGIDAAALRLNATDLAFRSEQEFVARFGEHATRIGEGHHRVTHRDVTYEYYFGRPALEASRQALERAIGQLLPAAGKSLSPAQHQQLEQLQQQHAKVQRDLLQPVTKQRSDSDGMDNCGYQVMLQADATPGWVNGSASAQGFVSPGGSPPDSLAFVEFTLYAIAGQPDYQGGLFGTPSISTVNFNTYSTSSSPPAAYAYTAGWQQCLRASGDAVVRRNPWFPDYCGSPIRVEAYSVDLNCPAGF